MKLKFVRLVPVVALPALALALAACGDGDGGGSQEPTPYPETIAWAGAADLLATGQVRMVAQSHALEVLFTMKDGSVIQTVEPRIDEIFRLVDACGAPCAGIALATE